ncbi:virion morphogenesis protein [Betaproteobacteria bacterium]|nr:virion morphogenesis protein [Betaproteobacteria bacterium]GHU48728.1 virion morphogenesis protein [Betaproteobacteria bacterium]
MPAPKPDLRASFNLPFAEQLEFFRGKVPLDTEHWDDIWQDAHDKSFIVAGAKGDLLADLMGAVDKSISKGTGLEEFRKDFRQLVAKHGWTGWTGEGTPAGEAWRTRVIWETNLRTSYMAGRYAQLTDPDLLARRPYWKYIHSEAVTNPRPQHLAWSGLVLRHDHPFWQTHFPPNGFGCQCRVTSVRAPGPDDATTPPEGWDKVGENGTLPGVGKGWAYAPGRSVAEGIRGIVEQKAEKLPEPLAAQLISASMMTKAFSDWFAHPEKGTTWPIARIPDADAIAIGAKDGVRVVVLSDETVAKQVRPGKHPEISPTEYAKVQETIDNSTHKVQESDHHIVYLRVNPTETEGGYVTVVKATKVGDKLFLASFRRLSRDEAERDATVRRILKRDTQ